jgi:hypothetical protein
LDPLEKALTKEPNRVGVALPSPEDRITSSFQNIFSGHLEYKMMDKVQQPLILSILALVYEGDAVQQIYISYWNNYF